LNHARNSNKNQRTYRKFNVPDCFYIRDFDSVTGFAYIYINNQSKKTLLEKIKFNGSLGINFIKPFIYPTAKYKVFPNSEALCLFRIDNEIL